MPEIPSDDGHSGRCSDSQNVFSLPALRALGHLELDGLSVLQSRAHSQVGLYACPLSAKPQYSA
jgi:hypothetical protein